MKIIFIAFLMGIIQCGELMAAPRGEVYVAKTYLNEGNSRTPIAVAVTSVTWVTVLNADVTRRSALLQTLSTATDAVCLSTFTTTNITCASTTKGTHLEPGGVVIDNSEAILYGRMADTISGTVYIYGMEYKDSKDADDATN
jgi:hypothetical protein